MEEQQAGRVSGRGLRMLMAMTRTMLRLGGSTGPKKLCCRVLWRRGTAASPAHTPAGLDELADLQLEAVQVQHSDANLLGPVLNHSSKAPPLGLLLLCWQGLGCLRAGLLDALAAVHPELE